MGLLTTYGAGNRVIEQDLTVTYNKILTHQDYTYIYGVAQEITIHSEWEYHRYASKQYKYVGMTLAAAQTCAAAMITKYTRSTKYSEWNSTGEAAGTFTTANGGDQLMAQISIVHGDGCMYSVQINVTEDDSRISTSNVTPSSLFSTENSRDYDTGNS